MARSSPARGRDDDYSFRLRYEALRSLLDKNIRCLQILADLEADLDHLSYSDPRMKYPLQRLVDEVQLMAQELNLLSGDRHQELYDVIGALTDRILGVFLQPAEGSQPELALPLDSDDALDPSLVGGKASGVAVLMRQFADSVPGGFVLTPTAYYQVLEENDLFGRIRLLLTNLDVLADRDALASRVQTIRGWIREARVPATVREAIETHASRVQHVGPTGWAVRSSAIHETSHFSFAGQYHSELRVEPERLVSAYLEVLAGRFTERAVIYRMHVGLREVETPMAVLFMPMVEPRAAGIVQTADLREPGSEVIVMNTVAGLGDEVVRGTSTADTFVLAREETPTLLRSIPADPAQGPSYSPTYIAEQEIVAVGARAVQVAEVLGHDVEVEWALSAAGDLYLLQVRRIYPAAAEEKTTRRGRKAPPIVEGGITVFPGRAEGEVSFLRAGIDPRSIPQGSVVVVDDPGPELSAILPGTAALLAAGGNPVGHVATLAREFAVPSLFRLGAEVGRLAFTKVVSVNATERKVYAGSRWVGVKKSVQARIASSGRHSRSGPLLELVIALNLTDPDHPSFSARSCQSIHDCLRFIHEMGVRSLFGLGDERKRAGRTASVKLETSLPVKMRVIDLDGSLQPAGRSITPDRIDSVPFRALWRGVSDPRLPWPERWDNKMAGVPRDLREAVLGAHRGPRRARDDNHAMVASDYLNLNARFAYHYAVVDAMVGPSSHSNHVHFRFRGGGAAEAGRRSRARLLETILRQLGFGIDRRGDLLTAWLRHHTTGETEAALEQLGRLIVCTRQLDAELGSRSDLERYSEAFLAGDYRKFGRTPGRASSE